MGTTSEWIRVLEFAGILGATMLLLDAITARVSLMKWPNLVATVLASFTAGMLMVFEWRVLHGRIAVVFALVLLVAFAAGYIRRRARRRAEIPFQSDNHQ